MLLNSLHEYRDMLAEWHYTWINEFYDEELDCIDEVIETIEGGVK